MPVAIVTGATRGIGEATARMLSAEGYWVLATGRDPQAGADLVKDLEQGAGGAFVAADLGDDATPERLVAAAVDGGGGLDLLVNNAGINLQADVAATTPELFDEVVGINLRAATLLAAASIRWMRAHGGGTIVNVSSEAGVLAFPGQVAYNVSKAALAMLTRSITADHSADGIRAVTVSPGTSATPLVQRLIDTAPDPEAMRAALEDRPASRLGRPEEIAAAIVFAASDAVDYLTGSEIVIDGGRTSLG